ncbi:MAG: hypothetical protein R3F29_07300 [Planctomycetota bacterium]
MPIPLRPAAATLCLAASLLAQCPPGAPMPQDVSLETTMPDGGPAHLRVQTGIAARDAGDLAAARRHFEAALEFHPSSPDVLLELVCSCGDDADLLALWGERFARALTTDKGKPKADAAVRKRLAAANGAADAVRDGEALAPARAAAITELLRYIEKNKSKGKQDAVRALLVRWASELLLEVGQGAPAALGSAADKVAAIQDALVADHDTVYKALADVMRRPIPAGDDNAPVTGDGNDPRTVAERRVRAARILVGLRRQGSFKDLQGPVPEGPGKLADDAQQLLDDDRKQAIANTKVWTIAELEAMTPEEALLFTRLHRDWHEPGLALSTTGRYRIETTCGHETLLGAAKTCELHHERLVAHFGSDPFVDRPGVIRIVPESADLETEGAGYWWAGGFQGGDRTTLRFSWGNIAGLGRGMTHELTHRFDGVLRPFLPSWYVEGHADWTGAHYTRMTDKKFLDFALKVGTVAHTFYKGYAGRKKFEKLIAGDVDDYRDNYFAGYTLCSFLQNYPPDAPRYRSALDRYIKSARGGQKDPLGYFTSVFCDGKEGRPAEFDELFAEWQTFTRGCYDYQDGKRDENKWVEKYPRPEDKDDHKLVEDEPTWSWAKNREEPYYGQDHAATATLLLHEVGDIEGTIAAGVWSLTVDGWRPEVAAALGAELARSRSQDAAAAFAVLSQAHFEQQQPPDCTPLRAALPKTIALVDALQQRATTLQQQQRPQAAAAAVRDHDRVARMFGDAVAPVPGARAALPRHLGAQGFTESGLTQFEDRRKKGLWYVTPEGDLHVGREKPREGTGVLDRRAHQRDAFAHSVAWIAPGHYALRGKVHFTTSFASGAIVFGHLRRDRDLRLSFSSGDFAYATGRRETNKGLGKVGFHLHGRWERDGDSKLSDTSPRATVEVPDEQNWFEYELLIQGAVVTVKINGEQLFRYAVHDGTPIEGQVGFATGMGAIRVQLPTVQRLDAAPGAREIGLDLAKQPTGDLDALLLLPTRGIPLDPNGTFVLWLPKMSEGSPTDRLGRSLRAMSGYLGDRLQYPQRWVMAVPKNLPKADRDDALAALADMRGDEIAVVEHDITKPFDDDEPWVLFVDGAGVLRKAASARSPKLSIAVRNWARHLRQRR